MRSVIILIGDSSAAMPFCQSLGQHINRSLVDERSRVTIAVWSVSSVYGQPPVGTAVAAGPAYIGELPKPHSVSLREIETTISSAASMVAAHLSVRVLEKPTVECVLELTRRVNADYLITGRPQHPSFIDRLMVPPHLLEFNISAIIREAPIPVIILPQKMSAF